MMTRDEVEALYDAGREEIVTKVLELSRENDELKEKIGRNSTNSSAPPSTDDPGAQARRKSAQPKRRKGRKPGGQPGHTGSHRPMLPPDEVEEHVPSDCEHCASDLSGVQPEPEPRRHQVLELPEVKVHVTEHQQFGVCCPDCEKVTWASLPTQVPKVGAGPRLLAVVGVLSGVYHLSKRMVVELLEDLLGASISLGSVCAYQKLVSEALAAPVEEARAHVQQQPAVHADETSWWQKHKRHWLWVAGTPMVAVFMIHASRGGDAARELLGTLGGILITDRWGAYNQWVTGMRQVCWAHLLRDFQAFYVRGGQSMRIGRKLLDEAHKMFHWWHRLRDGELSIRTFRRNMGPLRRRVEKLLEEGTECDNSKTAGSCKKMLKLREALWTFVDVEGVEPTNNFGERIIRAAVMWRKRSHGTQSESGSRFVERILTTVATCRLQRRNVLNYVTAACVASLRGEAAPSLLPAQDATDQPAVAA